MKIVPASESPCRKRALDMLGLAYETRPSRIDEKATGTTIPRVAPSFFRVLCERGWGF